MVRRSEQLLGLLFRQGGRTLHLPREHHRQPELRRDRHRLRVLLRRRRQAIRPLPAAHRRLFGPQGANLPERHDIHAQDEARRPPGRERVRSREVRGDPRAHGYRPHAQHEPVLSNFARSQGRSGLLDAPVLQRCDAPGDRRRGRYRSRELERRRHVQQFEQRAVRLGAPQGCVRSLHFRLQRNRLQRQRRPGRRNYDRSQGVQRWRIRVQRWRLLLGRPSRCRRGLERCGRRRG
mmetsp:Transcript_10994/g.27054  ORF Transcript_10994/g.27054 Transcript_10994/m.27054 type:complete len:235 (-) Transcript_10994:1326-2030(-)